MSYNTQDHLSYPMTKNYLDPNVAKPRSRSPKLRTKRLQTDSVAQWLGNLGKMIQVSGPRMNETAIGGREKMRQEMCNAQSRRFDNVSLLRALIPVLRFPKAYLVMNSHSFHHSVLSVCSEPRSRDWRFKSGQERQDPGARAAGNQAGEAGWQSMMHKPDFWLMPGG